MMLVSRIETDMASEGSISSLNGMQPMVLVGALLHHLPKFNVTNVLLDWKKLEGAA